MQNDTTPTRRASTYRDVQDLDAQLPDGSCNNAELADLPPHFPGLYTKLTKQTDGRLV
jgi:hypothetical protein